MITEMLFVNYLVLYKVNNSNSIYRCVLENDRCDTYIWTMRESMKQQPDIQVVVIVLPNDDIGRYNAVKKHFCIDDPSKLVYL